MRATAFGVRRPGAAFPLTAGDPSTGVRPRIVPGAPARTLLDWSLIIPCSILDIRLPPIHLIHPPPEGNGSDAATTGKQVSHAPRITGHSTVLGRGGKYKEQVRPRRSAPRITAHRTALSREDEYRKQVRPQGSLTDQHAARANEG